MLNIPDFNAGGRLLFGVRVLLKLLLYSRNIITLFS